MTITRRQTDQRMSQSIEFPLSGTMVVMAGQVSSDPSLDLAGQTQNILSRIDALLSEAGADKSMVTHAYVWLANIADFDSMNRVWDKWVSPGHAPARACVEARLANPKLRIEIQVFAVKT